MLKSKVMQAVFLVKVKSHDQIPSFPDLQQCNVHAFHFCNYGWREGWGIVTKAMSRAT